MHQRVQDQTVEGCRAAAPGLPAPPAGATRGVRAAGERTGGACCWTTAGTAEIRAVENELLADLDADERDAFLHALQRVVVVRLERVVQRLRVLPVDPVADSAQPREVAQVLRRCGTAGHLRDRATWHRSCLDQP